MWCSPACRAEASGVLRSEDAREHMLAPRPAKGGAALGLGVGSLETALILFDDTQGS